MKASQSPTATRKRFFENLQVKVFVTSLLVVALGLILLLAWQKSTKPAKPSDYEGKIVERWADNSGAAEGYQPQLALVIEANDGKRFTVKVDPTVYESASVGMRIRSRSGQIVLIDSDKTTDK